MWKVRQLQDDCGSFTTALLKSRNLQDEDDDTMLAQLSFKNSSVLAAQPLIKSEGFEPRRHSWLNRMTVGGEYDEE